MNKQAQDDSIRFGAFVNGAKQFCHCADLLLNRPNHETDPLAWSNDPIYLLYHHAAELALKGFLIFDGEKPSTLKKKWGHDLSRLYADSVSRGLVVPADYRLHFQNVMNLLQSGNKNEGFRYFTLESTTMPEIKWTGIVVPMLVDLVERQTGHVTGPPGPAVKFNMVFSMPQTIARKNPAGG